MAIKVGKILGRMAKAAAANPAVTVAIVAGVAPGLAAKVARLAPLVGTVLNGAVRDGDNTTTQTIAEADETVSHKKSKGLRS